MNSPRSESPCTIASEDLDERNTSYVFGINPNQTYPVLVVISPAQDGWRTRSTDRAYSHDYICFEDFQEVMEWIDCDLQRTFIAKDRDEAIETLTTNHNGSEHRLGFLYPGDVSPGSVEEAEKALQHLERGW